MLLTDEKKQFIKRVYNICDNVYNTLGCGYNETVYQNAVSTELHLLNIHHDKEATVPIVYKGHNVGFVRMDIVVRGYLPVVIEMKSIANIRQEERYQLIRYLNITNCDIGFLINYPSTKTYQIEVIIKEGEKYYKYDMNSGEMVEIA